MRSPVPLTLALSLALGTACEDASSNDMPSPQPTPTLSGTPSAAPETSGTEPASGGATAATEDTTPAAGASSKGGAGGSGGQEVAAGGASNGGGSDLFGGASGSSSDAGSPGVETMPLADAGLPGAGGAASNAGAGGAAPNASMGGGGGAGGSSAADEGDITDGRIVCPAGPFPAPMVVSSESVCQGFNLRYTWNEGPTWVPSQGAFFFSNFRAGSGSGGDIIKYTPGQGCENFIQDVGCNGLTLSNDGHLLAACQQTRAVMHFDLDTKQATVVADSYMGMMLDTPNDLVQHSNGTIYFTNPPNELDGRPQAAGPAAFSVDPMGDVSLIGQGNCNGIALSPAEDRLYVIQLGMWDLDEQGVPSGRQNLFTQGDGIAVDCAGNVYANGNIFSPDGNNIGSWGNGTNLAFGGDDGQTVLVAGPGQDLRQLTMNLPGPP